MIDWDKYELYINADLTKVPTDKYREILMISADGEISQFDGDKVHMYIGTDRLLLQYGNVTSHIINVPRNNMPLGNVEIICNKNAFYINGVKYASNHLYDDFVKMFDKPLTIGNENRNNYSVCTLNLVQLQPYQERS